MTRLAETPSKSDTEWTLASLMSLSLDIRGQIVAVRNLPYPVGFKVTQETINDLTECYEKTFQRRNHNLRQAMEDIVFWTRIEVFEEPIKNATLEFSEGLPNKVKCVVLDMFFRREFPSSTGPLWVLLDVPKQESGSMTQLDAINIARSEEMEMMSTYTFYLRQTAGATQKVKVLSQFRLGDDRTWVEWRCIQSYPDDNVEGGLAREEHRGRGKGCGRGRREEGEERGV